MAKRRTIKVDYLARVEGEGGMYVRVDDGRVKDVQLKIFEPPRFFEAFLRGRSYREAPDITARICGICPIAYQMSTVHALEDAFGVSIPEPVRALRRLLYCGEWIESHALHIFMLHAPDFLGYDSGIAMAKDHGSMVQTGLRLKKAGNQLVATIGGREIHPINVRVGGFFRSPTRAELGSLVDELKWARDAAHEAVRWVASFTFPDYEEDYEFVALRHESEYPFNEGRLVSSRGLDIAVREYEEHFEEQHVEHSNALHSVLKERGSYLVGPLARYALNADKLSPRARDAAREVGLDSVCRNPFRSIVVRAIEVLYAFDEALRIIENYVPPEPACETFEPRAGIGFACTEAPRGILFHRFRTDDAGDIVNAQIVPPTSQNQKSIEDDLRGLVPRILDRPNDEIRAQCEQAIRNYDPCISCATHFLQLDIDRR